MSYITDFVQSLRARGCRDETVKLRHRYATTVYRSSGDIRAVQELLGHARLDTTMIYTAVDSDTTASAAAGAWTLTG